MIDPTAFVTASSDGGHVSIAIAGEIEQSIAGQHLVGVVYEGGEQVEFAGGQPDLLARG